MHLRYLYDMYELSINETHMVDYYRISVIRRILGMNVERQFSEVLHTEDFQYKYFYKHYFDYMSYASHLDHRKINWGLKCYDTI